MPRINTKYNPGRGDTGYSHLLGKRIGDSNQTDPIELRKDDPACFIYGDCQELSLLIDTIRCECGISTKGMGIFKKIFWTILNRLRGQSPLKTPYLMEELEYLSKNAYCISGFCFLLGNSPQNVFPRIYLKRLESLIELYNETLNNAPDFVQKRQHISVIRINQLAEVVRKMERHFVTWQYHPEVTKNLYETIAMATEDDSSKAQCLGENILYTLAVLNRLSKFLFAAGRYENAVRGLSESYWAAQVEQAD